MADGAPVGAVGAPGGLAQYQPAQDAPLEAEDALAALSFAPVFGDVAGLAGDAAMYATDPSTRTPGNYAMTAAGALPFVPGAKAAMLAKALASVPAFSAITAWHGTPHLFDKFDSSKIGTGEGAQAYGHGLYFAESPEVAKSYQNELSSTISVDGKPVLAKNQIVGTTGNSTIDDLLMMHMGDLGAATKDWLSELRRLRQSFANQPRFTGPAMVGVEDKILKQHQRELAQLRNLRGRVSSTMDGALYSVDIPDEHIARMLDWDTHLSNQAPEVQAAIEPLLKDYIAKKQAEQAVGWGNALSMPGDESIPWSTPKGSESYFQLEKMFGTKAAASDALRQAGIPGIKYFDGISRGAGQGTRNFVVFPGEENALTILTRNGQPLK